MAAGDTVDFDVIVRQSSQYSDAHRGLLKIIIDRGSLTQRAFCAHYIRCCVSDNEELEKNVDTDNNQLNLKNVTSDAVSSMLDKLVTTINTKLQHLGMRLMKAHDEVSKKKMIIIVSERHYSAGLAAASPFDKNELFLVSSWLEEMLKADNDGYVAITKALKSAGSLPVPMKMDKAQLLIDRLMQMNWFRSEAGDMLTLTTRGLTELGPILKSRYHCDTCALCSNVTIRKASMLSCDDCECLLHVSCWRNYAQTIKTPTVQCPAQKCKSKLNKDEMEASIDRIEKARDNPVRRESDEEEDEVEEDRRRRKEQRKKKSSSPKRAKKSGGKRDESDEEEGEEEPEEREEREVEAAMEEEEEEEEEEEMVVKRRGRPKRGEAAAASQRARAVKEEEEMEVEEEEEARPPSRKHPRRSSTQVVSTQKQPRKKAKEEIED